jgi:hypothetical protein
MGFGIWDLGFGIWEKKFCTVASNIYDITYKILLS